MAEIASVSAPSLVCVEIELLFLLQWLSYGADSNGSGVAVLLELARLFHKLYSDRRTQAGSQMDIRKLRRNTAIVAEALASFMYNFTEKEVQESRLPSLVHWLSSQSRAAQLLERDPGLLPTLELQLSRYLRQVQRHTFLTDKR
ncbi:UNVERIFIED_CONTAM: hypothetical protein FKN15_014849 [Acipenser sinensis]